MLMFLINSNHTYLKPVYKLPAKYFVTQYRQIERDFLEDFIEIYVNAVMVYSQVYHRSELKIKDNQKKNVFMHAFFIFNINTYVKAFYLVPYFSLETIFSAIAYFLKLLHAPDGSCDPSLLLIAAEI